MQSVTQPTNQNLSSSMRRVSLVSEARENRDAAFAAWTAAYNAWKAEPTGPNSAALAMTCQIHSDAEKLYQSLSYLAKHNKGTVKSTEVPYV